MRHVKPATRWVTAHPPDHAQRYIDRFRRLAAEGADLDGEARLLDAMLQRRSHVLDAGCGTGRVGAALATRGHTVVGVDADEQLVAAARADHASCEWLVADLAELDLRASGIAPFDAVVMAGNVMPFVAPETEARVLERIAAHVRHDGIVVMGFSLQLGYALADLDAHAAAAGLRLEHRFASWELRPFESERSYAVSVFRRESPEPRS